LNITNTFAGSSYAITTNWTIQTNAPPKGGKLLVQPLVGYRKTTNFMMNCGGFTDDSNATSFQTRFYSIEANTGGQINYIQNYTSAITADYVFDVKYFNIPKTVITVYCEVKDNMLAISTLSQNVLYYYLYSILGYDSK